MLFRSVVLAALASYAAADLASIAASLAKIDGDTATLNSSVLYFEKFDNLVTAVPILFNTVSLSADLSNGTQTANASEPLTQDEALQLVPPVQQLARDVNITVTNLINAYAAFEKNSISVIVLVSLQGLRNNSMNYSDAIIAKVPVNLQDAARMFVAPINAAFDQAIAVYSLTSAR